MPLTLEVLEERLKSMDEKLDKLVESVDGNGQAGLKLRVDRLEQSRAFASKVLWVLFGATISLLASTVHDKLSAEPPAAVHAKR